MKDPYIAKDIYEQAVRLIDLQRQGKFLVTTRDLESGAPPLPTIKELGLRRGRYPFAYEADWGRFTMDYPASALVLAEGEPPAEWLPQPLLQLSTAVIHPEYVRLVTASRTDPGVTIEIRQEESDYRFLRRLNAMLRSERQPYVVWKLEWQADDNALQVISIANESAMVFASSAVWSPADSQLVAALVASPTKELLVAIRATLANNSNKGWITVKSPSDNAFLRGAKRGFVHISSSLARANAVGSAAVLLHPLSGNPQEESAEYFYVVALPGESLPDKFGERLALAIPWPTQPTWSKYLLAAGQEAGLLEFLPVAGPDFTAAVRVSKDEAGWQSIIEQGLQAKAIEI